jgi:hypothetical protein
LLSSANQDAFGAMDATRPVLVLILGNFAHELGAMGAQTPEDAESDSA